MNPVSYTHLDVYKRQALAEADTALKEKKNQDTVDKATEKLNKAISALVKKDAGQKVNGTNGTTGTSGKSGKTGSTSNTKMCIRDRCIDRRKRQWRNGRIPVRKCNGTGKYTVTG